MNERQPFAASAAPLYLLFILSGAAGLIYEVIWMRMLAVSLGATAPAVAAVLAAFMGGLALGSYFGGRAVDRWGKPLLWYAALELVVALYALLFPVLHRMSDDVARVIYTMDADALRLAIRFLYAGALLLLPTVAMGATTPAVVAAVRERRGDTAASFSGAYAANAFGAAVGVLFGGFWLLWHLGTRLSLVATATVNVAVAAAAFALATKFGVSAAAPGGADEKKAAGGRALWAPLAAAFMSGAVALAAQVFWTRALANVFGSAGYAFAAMLAVILFAIAAGSFIHRRLAPATRGANWFYGALCLGGGAFLSLSIFILRNAPYLFLRGFGAAGDGFNAALALVFALSGMTLFLPSFALGMVLPVTVAAAAERHPGRRVGTLYAANTAGAIVGSLVGTFALLPTLGPVGGLRAAAVSAVAAAFLFGLDRKRARWLPAAAAAAFSLALAVPGPDPHTLTLGPGINPNYYLDASGRVDLRDAAFEGLAFYRESVDASVAVLQYGAVRSLKINGKVVASTNYDDLRVEKALGELPVAACPHPRDVLVIGLGTGITLGAVTASAAPERVVCVELNPAVPAASRFFDRWSGAPLDDKRLVFRRDDGRSYVLATRERFDVITSDPIHPWTKGSSSLFTVEHFSNCRALLNPGGVMAQWLPMYQLAPRDYLTVIASFGTAFPHIALYTTGRDTVLLGAAEDVPAVPAYAPFLVAREDKLRALYRGIAPDTEDKLTLEYTAPLNLYANTEGPNLDLLLGAREAGGDDKYRAATYLMKGRRRVLDGDDGGAEAAYAAGFALWPENVDLREGLADIYFERGLAAAAAGDEGAARGWFMKVLTLTPDDVAARENLSLLGVEAVYR